MTSNKRNECVCLPYNYKPLLFRAEDFRSLSTFGNQTVAYHMTKIKAQKRNKNKTTLLSQALSPRDICYSWCEYDLNVTKQPPSLSF